MARREELTDEQWSLMNRYLIKQILSKHAAEREVLDGILWILRSEASGK